MPDSGPHPSLLLAEFPAALARFLDAHAGLHVKGEIRPINLASGCKMVARSFQAPRGSGTA
jgi:hypothetical protein